MFFDACCAPPMSRNGRQGQKFGEIRHGRDHTNIHSVNSRQRRDAMFDENAKVRLFAVRPQRSENENVHCRSESVDPEMYRRLSSLRRASNKTSRNSSESLIETSAD